ncbi:thermonuclease family protein [Tistrella mobilis]|uniref:thermonuclease family protein n=1 Tax=Tistrella mobilis TaxID=171437 RepID=UPI0035579ED8
MSGDDVAGRDRYRRALALCQANGEDLGARLVRDGLALAYRRYSGLYLTPEADARGARFLRMGKAAALQGGIDCGIGQVGHGSVSRRSEHASGSHAPAPARNWRTPACEAIITRLH